MPAAFWKSLKNTWNTPAPNLKLVEGKNTCYFIRNWLVDELIHKVWAERGGLQKMFYVVD